jgi:hypothetical protein
MKNEKRQLELERLQKSFVSEVLTLAEIGLPSLQFRQFKKKIFALYHDQLKPESWRILSETPKSERSGLGRADKKTILIERG